MTQYNRYGRLPVSANKNRIRRSSQAFIVQGGTTDGSPLIEFVGTTDGKRFLMPSPAANTYAPGVAVARYTQTGDPPTDVYTNLAEIGVRNDIGYIRIKEEGGGNLFEVDENGVKLQYKAVRTVTTGASVDQDDYGSWIALNGNTGYTVTISEDASPVKGPGHWIGFYDISGKANSAPILVQGSGTATINGSNAARIMVDTDYGGALLLCTAEDTSDWVLIKFKGPKDPDMFGTSRLTTCTTTVVYGERMMLVSTAGGNRTINLPPAIQYKNQFLIVKKTTADANVITVDGNGSETIDGSASRTLSDSKRGLFLFSDGSNWWIVAAPSPSGPL